MRKIIYGIFFTGTLVNTFHLFKLNSVRTNYKGDRENLDNWLNSSVYNQLVTSPKITKISDNH